ncbi:ROK family transcriptional regulator [Catenulispora rubra]|uniref:ROK family transcriptional regulator n=1 Tax=Catenulispora rubra TaxID=280293 RepID=UPI001891F716|nr:ROK family transcriptional regulator [Catenulispora rubra]
MAVQGGGNVRDVRDVRRSNKSLLLRHLYFHRLISRLDLSRATGLSTATVSSVVAELIEAGLVVEAGAVESEGGRPRILLDVNAPGFQVVGVDVGETHIRVERFDLLLNELARAEIPVVAGRYEPEAVVAEIAAGLAAVGVPDAGLGVPVPVPVLGVGIGLPGIVVGHPDSVVHCQTIGWDAVPMAALMREVTDLPVFIDNGVSTMGQAEMWFGAGLGAADTVFLLIGSGIGSAMTVGGLSYRGSTTSAGEWGHVTAEVGGRQCRCGARGCLEAYIGAESIIARFCEVERAEHGSAVTGSAAGTGPAAVTGPAAGAAADHAAAPAPMDEEAALLDILAAAHEDPASARARAARTVLDETAVHLGVGIGNLINLFNPERVIVGGWAGLLLADEILPRVREVAREHSLRYPFSRTSLELGRLGRDAVARGAATLPVARFLDDGGKVIPAERRRVLQQDVRGGYPAQ